MDMIIYYFVPHVDVLYSRSITDHHYRGLTKVLKQTFCNLDILGKQIHSYPIPAATKKPAPLYCAPFGAAKAEHSVVFVQHLPVVLNTSISCFPYSSVSPSKLQTYKSQTPNRNITITEFIIVPLYTNEFPQHWYMDVIAMVTSLWP